MVLAVTSLNFQWTNKVLLNKAKGVQFKQRKGRERSVWRKELCLQLGQFWIDEKLEKQLKWGERAVLFQSSYRKQGGGIWGLLSTKLRHSVLDFIMHN